MHRSAETAELLAAPSRSKGTKFASKTVNQSQEDETRISAQLSSPLAAADSPTVGTTISHMSLMIAIRTFLCQIYGSVLMLPTSQITKSKFHNK
jgi:hypothetical protein